MNQIRLLALFGFAIVSVKLSAQAKEKMLVQANMIRSAIQPTMYGIFFEDINFGADGGIYAELVKNRSFEFYMPLMGWKEQKAGNTTGAVEIINRGDVPNPRFARFKVKTARGYGITNEGFRGMGIKKDNQYDFSVWARLNKGIGCAIRVELRNAQQQIIGEAGFSVNGSEWKQYKVSFTATATEPKASLNIWFDEISEVDMDMVSLFPRDTWRNRAGGMRKDLIQLLADLKPGFLRFPGGCIVEGHELQNRYQWKKTVGDVYNRQQIVNRWNTEFRHRLTPDYYQSFGVGFYEYFLLAEDIGASPLPILNCGMACQFNTSELVPLDQLDPYVQDALDLIEFANGGTDTRWGKLRADMGHPAPFNLSLLGIGNEQWGEQYIERYKVFAKAIAEKYPGIKLVTSVGPSPDGELFDYLNPRMRALKADILDEHYYKPPEWFQQHANRYDNYDRNGPKIFAGEYAAQSKGVASPDNRNNWKCALSEAAFITGLERNADVVYMSSYAPLFAHAEGWQWTPDLIWFDNLRSYGTPNYYVQKLFSLNKGTHVVPITLNDSILSGIQGLYATASIDKNTSELIIKLVNTSGIAQQKELMVEGVRKLGRQAQVTVLKSDNADAVNSLDDPAAISPVESVVDIKGKKIPLSAAPYSFTVYRVRMQ